MGVFVNAYLDTPLTLTNASNAIVWNQELSPYGEELGSEQNQVQYDQRFPGQYEDGVTGLRYNRFRYYLNSEGIYLTADPLGLRGSDVNFYMYSGNNPITNYDSLGLTKEINDFSILLDEYVFTEGNAKRVAKRIVKPPLPASILLAVAESKKNEAMGPAMNLWGYFHKIHVGCRADGVCSTIPYMGSGEVLDQYSGIPTNMYPLGTQFGDDGCSVYLPPEASNSKYYDEILKIGGAGPNLLK